MTEAYRFLREHLNNPKARTLSARLQAAGADTAQILKIYTEAIPLVEDELWSAGIDEAGVKRLQQLFQEMEHLISQANGDYRHDFIVIIPVADRPRQLSDCLGSLLILCRAFHYGDTDNGRFKKVSAIIADDSREPGNINQHRKMAEHFSQLGLTTDYFGLDEQLGEIAKLDKNEREKLTDILGNVHKPPFHHKGAAIMRNIVYLKLNGLKKNGSRTLLWFVDSDKEFQISANTKQGDRNLYAVNYFHHLDRIFSECEVNILTGNTVGAPTVVSPAAMAGDLLEDIIGFLTRIAKVAPTFACDFHNRDGQPADDAFYQCPLPNTHNHIDCFRDFANRLNHFFDGEHPTRKTAYEHAEVLSTIKPARTLHTGNYIFRPGALKHFIPFANLKLHMAGPTQGHLLQAEVKQQFVSANLPLLHKCTVDNIGGAELRPGTNRKTDILDLTKEFERLFFGDVVLFSIIKLTERGFPDQVADKVKILEVVEETEREMHEKYLRKQKSIEEKLTRLKSLFEDNGHWWRQTPALEQAMDQISSFILNIELNFGANAKLNQLINTTDHKQKRLQDIAKTIAAYNSEKTVWIKALAP